MGWSKPSIKVFRSVNGNATFDEAFLSEFQTNPMKCLTALPILMIMLASCHKTNQAIESGLIQQWKLSEWDVSGPGTVRFYPQADTSIILSLNTNGSYSVQINGQSYSNGTFSISDTTFGGISYPEVIFSRSLLLKPGLSSLSQNFYSISGGTLTFRSANFDPGYQYSYIFQAIHP